MPDQDEVAALRTKVEALESEVASLRAAAVAATVAVAQGCTCGTTSGCKTHPWQFNQVMYPQNTWMAANACAGGYAASVVQIPQGSGITYTARVPAAGCAGGGIPQVWTVNC